jgi:hypothetical protein
MGLKNTREDKIFASVLADGKIHVTVPEGTEGSVLRTYETSDGKTGSKNEMIYTELFGKIIKIGFFEGDFGKQFQVTVQDGKEKPVCLSLGTASNYGEDMMKKIFNVDMEKYVKIVPFSFEDDKGKNKKGVTIYQLNEETKKQERVENYFYDKEKKCNVHDYPEPKKGKVTKANPEGKLTKDQWKIYFAECREFLVEKITEHFKLDEVAESTDDFDKQVDEINESAEVPEKF